jgi:hypothetical protein
MPKNPSPKLYVHEFGFGIIENFSVHLLEVIKSAGEEKQQIPHTANLGPIGSEYVTPVRK